MSDKNGYVIWGNTRVIKTLKATEETFIGKHLSKWGEENWNNCKKVIETGLKYKEEEIGIDDDIYLTNRKPFFSNDQSTVLGVSIDITDEKKAELAKQALLENARHDIRTPFSGIVGFSHVVHSTNDINKIKEYTQDLVLSTEEFLEYHNKLLEAIKVADTASGIFQKRKLNLMEEMVSVIDIRKLVAMTKGIELDLIYDKNILTYPYFISDPIQVHRIALELVTNAIKFTERGKLELQVNIKKKDLEKSIIEISVSDTGIGYLLISKKRYSLHLIVYPLLIREYIKERG
ncbi:sensor histidine kinase [Rickettsiella massiliensis]|uniref:sensor histidine kinase n=1 Tax=Rickettsiella massiliensis TaxID=676517 RepID=UPI00029A53E6|nr:HAMP domain-containing sensor histidine kinase [Rickettsiella massiliensis]